MYKQEDPRALSTLDDLMKWVNSSGIGDASIHMPLVIFSNNTRVYVIIIGTRLNRCDTDGNNYY